MRKRFFFAFFVSNSILEIQDVLKTAIDKEICTINREENMTLKKSCFHGVPRAIFRQL